MRLGLLLAEIGTKHDITVTEQEMQRALFAQARQYPGQERQFFEFVQKNPQALQQIRAPLFEDKVVDFILELAQVTEKPVSKDELQKAIEALGDDVPTPLRLTPPGAPVRRRGLERPPRTPHRRRRRRRRRASSLPR